MIMECYKQLPFMEYLGCHQVLCTFSALSQLNLTTDMRYHFRLNNAKTEEQGTEVTLLTPSHTLGRWCVRNSNPSSQTLEHELLTTIAHYYISGMFFYIVLCLPFTSIRVFKKSPNGIIQHIAFLQSAFVFYLIH